MKSNTLQIGDSVIFLNEKGGGTISKIIDNKTAVVTTSDGFNYPYPIHELIKKEDSDVLKKHVEISPVRIKDQEIVVKSSTTTLNQRISKGIKEVDLHIDCLTDDYSKMAQWEILYLQISYFKRCMEQAFANDEKRIIFIHGVGEGILKYEIRKILKEYEGIEFFDAPYNEYGQGATEVIFY